MNDAHIHAQIEQLDMRLSQMIDDCALMKVEIGRLRAGRLVPGKRYEILEPLSQHPDKSWQEDEVVQEIHDAAELREIAQHVIDPNDDHPESWQTEDVQPTITIPFTCESCGNEIKTWDDGRGWYCFTCRVSYEIANANG